MKTLLRIAIPLLLACPACAETRIVEAQQLVLTNTLSSTVEIDTDRSLAGRVRISAGGSLACLSVIQGTASVIGTGGCDDDDLGTLHIVVSPDMPVTLTSNGDGALRIADMHAPLTVTMTGEGDLKAGSAASLVLALHGSGDAAFGDIGGPASLEIAGSGSARLGELHGPLTVKRHGSGDVVIGEVESAAVTIESRGSGDTLIGRGHVGDLTVSMAGSGDLGLAAELARGRIDVSGGGDVKLGRVTGELQRSAAGGSTITLGGSAVATEIMSRVANAAASRDSADDDSGSRSHRSGSMILHFLTIGTVGVMLFLAWRVVRRGGGLRSWNRPVPSSAPLHPGVATVCDTMNRLEQRLGRLETYVTTREFDLSRKIRDLGR